MKILKFQTIISTRTTVCSVGTIFIYLLVFFIGNQKKNINKENKTKSRRLVDQGLKALDPTKLKRLQR